MFKKKLLLVIFIEFIVSFGYYYIVLPPLNIQSMDFWAFIFFIIVLFLILNLFITFDRNVEIISKRKIDFNIPVLIKIPIIMTITIFLLICLIDLFCSPLFNAKSYAKRILIDETGDFSNDINEVDFNNIPLLDRDSSEKLGDRVMGQMSEFVSQYYVSDQYTQINYNNDIIRVTPLEYGDFIKWINNRKDGVKGYITVDSVSGEAKLIKLEKGMKYLPSAHFNEKLERKLRFLYPTKIFGDYKFEIDNDGNPYFIIPTYGYTGVNLKAKVNGTIIFNPITGKAKLYSLKDVPTWVDNAYNASLIIEQINNWGEYNGGFINSIFGQKNVTKTTDGYNYLAMNDDIYLYTGITSVLSDESNLGFVLTNMRTSETVFYSVPGAEEYSAMKSAEGQVQQMNYSSTFPLLINLNNKPTYLVSLKDAAGLVKMYGFVDVEDYQRVTVTDSSKGIKTAALNYLSENADEINSDLLIKKEITVDKIVSANINGNTYYYIVSDGKKYKISINLSDKLPFASASDKLIIYYYSSENDVINVEKVE